MGKMREDDEILEKGRQYVGIRSPEVLWGVLAVFSAFGPWWSIDGKLVIKHAYFPGLLSFCRFVVFNKSVARGKR